MFAGPGVAGAIRNQFNQVTNTVDSGTDGDSFMSAEERIRTRQLPQLLTSCSYSATQRSLRPHIVDGPDFLGLAPRAPSTRPSREKSRITIRPTAACRSAAIGGSVRCLLTSFPRPFSLSIATVSHRPLAALRMSSMFALLGASNPSNCRSGKSPPLPAMIPIFELSFI